MDLVDDENQEDEEDEGSLCTRSSAVTDLAINPAIDEVILTNGVSIGRRGDKLFRVRALPPEAATGKRKRFRRRHAHVLSALI